MVRRTLFLLLIFWLSGGFIFYYYSSKYYPDNNNKTDAIVVLTGSSGRIELGFKLMRNSLAEKLFISGVDHKATLNDFKDKSLEDMPIFLGYQSYDTISNAKEVFNWSRKENIQSLRLITTNTHMPRALMIFKKAMPDILIIPHPLRIKNTSLLSIIREYNKFLLTSLGLLINFKGI